MYQLIICFFSVTYIDVFRESLLLNRVVQLNLIAETWWHRKLCKIYPIQRSGHWGSSAVVLG